MLSRFQQAFRWIVPFAALALLPACATTGGKVTDSAAAETSLTPAQRQMRERNEKLRMTVVEGALVGAGVGALIGTVATGGSRDGALIGGVIGAGLGTIAGSIISENQKEAGERLDTIQGLTASIRTKNEETEAAIQGINEVIAEDKRKIALLNKQLKANKIEQSKYKQELALIQADQEEIRKTAKSLNAQVEAYEKKAAVVGKDASPKDTKALKENMDKMKANVKRMNRISEIAEKMAPASATG